MTEVVVLRKPDDVDPVLDDMLGKGRLQGDLAWLRALVHRFVAAGVEVEAHGRRGVLDLRLSERLSIPLFSHGSARRLLLEQSIEQLHLRLHTDLVVATREKIEAVCRIFHGELESVALSDDAYEAKASVTPKAFW